MNAIEKMQIVLLEDYGIYVPKEEIITEGVLLYADEIDETLLPIEMLVGVTEPIQTEIRKGIFQMMQLTSSETS